MVAPEQRHQESAAGSVWAALALLAMPVALGLLVYVEFNPHQLVFLDGGLIVIWAGGFLVSLIGGILAGLALVQSRFRRTAAWLAAAGHMLILLYAVIRPLVVVIAAIASGEVGRIGK